MEICHVLTSTEDTLLRELELDRPSALGGPGPRPSFCSGAPDHRWREKRLCLLSIQTCVLAVLRHAMTALWPLSS